MSTKVITGQAPLRASRRITTSVDPPVGRLSAGNSSTKTGVAYLRTVRFITRAMTGASVKPMRSIANRVSAGSRHGNLSIRLTLPSVSGA